MEIVLNMVLTALVMTPILYWLIQLGQENWIFFLGTTYYVCAAVVAIIGINASTVDFRQIDTEDTLDDQEHKGASSPIAGVLGVLVSGLAVDNFGDRSFRIRSIQGDNGSTDDGSGSPVAYNDSAPLKSLGMSGDSSSQL
eukprot:scaffold551_cov395-Prasinococcus_capsulatus_cf.AAC.6